MEVTLSREQTKFLWAACIIAKNLHPTDAAMADSCIKELKTVIAPMKNNV